MGLGCESPGLVLPGSAQGWRLFGCWLYGEAAGQLRAQSRVSWCPSLCLLQRGRAATALSQTLGSRPSSARKGVTLSKCCPPSSLSPH